MQLAVDDNKLCRIVFGARLAARDLEQALYLGFGRMLGRECCSRAFEGRAHGVELHQLLRIEVGNHHAVPRTVGEQALGDDAMKRLAHRRATDVQPLGHVRLTQMLAGSEFTGANGLPHGPIREIAKRFSAPLMRRLTEPYEMQAALASNGWTALGFYVPASRSETLCRRGLAEWRFHRTNGREPILVS